MTSRSPARGPGRLVPVATSTPEIVVRGEGGLGLDGVPLKHRLVCAVAVIIPAGKPMTRT